MPVKWLLWAVKEPKKNCWTYRFSPFIRSHCIFIHLMVILSNECLLGYKLKWRIQFFYVVLSSSIILSMISANLGSNWFPLPFSISPLTIAQACHKLNLKQRNCKKGDFNAQRCQLPLKKTSRFEKKKDFDAPLMGASKNSTK